MLNFNSVMIGTSNVKKLADFYEQVIGKKPDMSDDSYVGWVVGSTFLNIGEHSEVSGEAKEPARIILNFETNEVKSEFERIKSLGAKVIKEPYGMTQDGKVSTDESAMWIATLADPDGNYFQLMSPWEGDKS